MKANIFIDKEKNTKYIKRNVDQKALSQYKRLHKDLGAALIF